MECFGKDCDNIVFRAASVEGLNVKKVDFVLATDGRRSGLLRAEGEVDCGAFAVGSFGDMPGGY